MTHTVYTALSGQESPKSIQYITYSGQKESIRVYSILILILVLLPGSLIHINMHTVHHFNFKIEYETLQNQEPSSLFLRMEQNLCKGVI